MNHNPHNLQEGDEVILDKDFNNSSEVILLNFTKSQVYATVYSDDSKEQWTVMTNRLSPKAKIND